ncbi:MAG: deoxyguanosinetriphosphate triphosphohydrolase [bacterium]
MRALNPREEWEAIEPRILSPHAQLSSHSRGRARPEPLDPIRTEYQRDRDRILHSKAFRRLKHKTQVLFSPQGDHYRTRLTHTLEVAQIARTIGRALHLNEDLSEAIALGHDLGHPPFGHVGERALDSVYRDYDAAGFRHYIQSLRIVDTLEKDGKGLNLTYEVRDGIAHHSKGRKNIAASESVPETLEGQVVRIADRIAYINHDLDDAIRAGVLRLQDVPKRLTRILGSRHSRRIATIVADVVDHSAGKRRISISTSIGKAMDELKEFLFERVYLRPELHSEVERVDRLISFLFHHYLDHGPPNDHGFSRQSPSARARQACDYVAGMTDPFAIRTVAELLEPRAWRSEIV